MDFKKLREKIASEQLGSNRLTDIPAGTYSLVLPATDEGQIVLVNEKKNKYPITPRGLASMRIVTDKSKLTVKTTKEARESEEFSNLQKAIVEDNFEVSETTKFNVVGHLRIHDAATDACIMKNQWYIGYPEYVKKTRKIANLPRVTKDEIAARTAGFTEASESLRASGVKKGADAPKDVDENYLLMPVFTVTN